MATKEQKQTKIFAEKLLRIQGLDYDEWLDQKHQEVINENQGFIMELVDSQLKNHNTFTENPEKPNHLKDENNYQQ